MNDDEAQNWLTSLNEMLDTWNTERDNLFTVAQTVLPLIANKSSYQIGPTGADFPATPRPLLIQSAAQLTYTSGGGQIRNVLDLLTSQEWQAILEKTNTAILALQMYCDYGFPYSTIYLSPAPNFAQQLELFIWQPLPQFADIHDSVDVFPPGYKKPLRFNLAVNIAPEVGVQVDAPAWQNTKDVAIGSKAEMQNLNRQFLQGALGQNTTGQIPIQGNVPPPGQQGPPQQ